MDLNEFADTTRTFVRNTLPVMLWAGLTPGDVISMLRAHVLLPARGRNPDPCQAHVAGPNRAALLPRDLPQRGIPADRAAGAPLNRLMCPVHERALSGQAVPCGVMHKGAPPAPDLRHGEATMFLTVMQQPGMKPCLFLQAAIAAFLPEFLGIRASERWPAGDVPPSQLRALARSLRAESSDEDEELADDVAERPGDTVAAHRRQSWLVFLLGTGRLSQSELREMANHLIFSIDPGWLPCRDDAQRDRLAVSGQRVPAARFLCPLQVRALRGDATVPCCEARDLKPAADLLRRVRDEYPPEALRRVRPPQVVYWSRSSEEPGRKNDLVQVLEVRPCQALGEVIMQGMVWLLRGAASRFQGERTTRG